MDLLLLAAGGVTALVAVLAAVWIVPLVVLAAIASLADEPALGRAGHSMPAASSSESRS
jgi:hypothetical protein